MILPRLGLALPALLLAFAPVAQGDDTAEFLKPDNWQGKSDIWTLNGRTIVGESQEPLKYNTFFCSKEKYGDFELTFQVQLRDEIGNSGVQIRSQLIDAEKFVVAGPQPDIGKGYWGSVYGERFDKQGKIGGGHMMKAADPETIKRVVKGTEFNDYTIIAKGKRVTVKINGETMVDEEFAIMPDEGIIAFQAHAGPPMRVEFREITFKKLK
jgi:hypothetical protein